MSVETVRNILTNMMIYSELKGLRGISEFIENRKEMHDAEIEREIDHLMILQENN